MNRTQIYEKKFYVNSRFLTQKITGSQRFAIEISRQFKRLNPDIKFIAPKNIIHENLAKELSVEVVGFNTGHIWEQIDLPIYLKSKGSPLLINLANTAPIFYKNKISTIMDLSWKHLPNSVSIKFYLWYNFLIPKITKNSLHIFTISDYSRRDLIKILELEESKITNIYPSTTQVFKPTVLKKEKNILSVASLQPYKNLERLVDAYLLLKRKKDFDYKLILVGGLNKKVFAASNLFSKVKNQKDIILAGYVDDNQLVEYYNKSLLFVFPSLYEGFGLPPLEAMSCGCPCVVSNVTSLPEVCADAAYYVDPYSVESIAEGIERVLTDENLRQNLIKKGFENVKRFSWEKSANKMVNIIESLNL